jgi:hypothetical protein
VATAPVKNPFGAVCVKNAHYRSSGQVHYTRFCQPLCGVKSREQFLALEFELIE